MTDEARTKNSERIEAIHTNMHDVVKNQKKHFDLDADTNTKITAVEIAIQELRSELTGLQKNIAQISVQNTITSETKKRGGKGGSCLLCKGGQSDQKQNGRF